MKERIMTRKEAAEFLKIPLRSLDYYVSTRQVPFSRIGKKTVRFRESRLLKFLDEREGIAFNRGKSTTDVE